MKLYLFKTWGWRMSIKRPYLKRVHTHRPETGDWGYVWKTALPENEFTWHSVSVCDARAKQLLRSAGLRPDDVARDEYVEFDLT